MVTRALSIYLSLSSFHFLSELSVFCQFYLSISHVFPGVKTSGRDIRRSCGSTTHRVYMTRSTYRTLLTFCLGKSVGDMGGVVHANADANDEIGTRDGVDGKACVGK